MNFKDEIIELLRGEAEGLTTRQLHEFFPDLKYQAFSGKLSYAYGTGGLRREREGTSNMFRYWLDEGATPQPVVSRKHLKQPTPLAVGQEVADLRAKIAELEAWKAEAIARYPTLAVPAVVLRAREIVAADLKEHLDPQGAEQVLQGRRDDTAVIRSVVRALELAA